MGEETDRAGAWGASRPSRPWLGVRPPGRRPGLRLSAGPAMLERGRRSGHVPGRDTRHPGSARRGSPRGSGRGGRRAPAVQADERRRSHASAGPPRARSRPALRTSRPQAPLGSPPNSAGRKVTWLGPGARARCGVGTGLGRASSGRCAEDRAWGGSRRLGPLAALPAPFFRSHGGSAGCGGAHAQGRRPARLGRGGGGAAGLQDRRAAAAFSIVAQGRARGRHLQTVANRVSLWISTAISARLSIPPRHPRESGGRVFLTFR